MRFLTDENIPSNIVDWLIAEGHDVVSARITGAGTKDEQWLSLAVPEERIIITADKDFGELIFRDGLAAYGIILLRLDDVLPRDWVERIKETWSVIESSQASRFIVITSNRIRVRQIT